MNIWARIKGIFRRKSEAPKVAPVAYAPPAEPPIDWREINRGNGHCEQTHKLPVFGVGFLREVVSRGFTPLNGDLVEWRRALIRAIDKEASTIGLLTKFTRKKREARREAAIESVIDGGSWPTVIEVPDYVENPEGNLVSTLTPGKTSTLIVPSIGSVVATMEAARAARRKEWDDYRAKYYLDPETPERRV